MRKQLLTVVWFATWFVIGYTTGVGRLMFQLASTLID